MKTYEYRTKSVFKYVVHQIIKYLFISYKRNLKWQKKFVMVENSSPKFLTWNECQKNELKSAGTLLKLNVLTSSHKSTYSERVHFALKIANAVHFRALFAWLNKVNFSIFPIARNAAFEHGNSPESLRNNPVTLISTSVAQQIIIPHQLNCWYNVDYIVNPSAQ